MSQLLMPTKCNGYVILLVFHRVLFSWRAPLSGTALLCNNWTHCMVLIVTAELRENPKAVWLCTMNCFEVGDERTESACGMHRRIDAATCNIGSLLKHLPLPCLFLQILDLSRSGKKRLRANSLNYCSFSQANSRLLATVRKIVHLVITTCGECRFSGALLLSSIPFVPRCQHGNAHRLPTDSRESCNCL